MKQIFSYDPSTGRCFDEEGNDAGQIEFGIPDNELARWSDCDRDMRASYVKVEGEIYKCSGIEFDAGVIVFFAEQEPIAPVRD